MRQFGRQRRHFDALHPTFPVELTLSLIFIPSTRVITKVLRVILMLITACTLFGCSNRAIYENIQLHNRQQCAQLPPSQYDDCMEEINKSYDEYEREREESLE